MLMLMMMMIEGEYNDEDKDDAEPSWQPIGSVFFKSF